MNLPNDKIFRDIGRDKILEMIGMLWVENQDLKEQVRALSMELAKAHDRANAKEEVKQ